MGEMADEDDDVLLVMLVQRGDRAAFERLLRRLHAPMRRYVAKMVGDLAVDDVLQEMALRIFREIGNLREPRAFRAWVFRIATRLSFVSIKREKRWREAESNFDPIHPQAPHRDEFDPDVLALVDRVSPASRAVLLLHYQQCLSLEETAAILDIPIGTAKSRLSYGVSTLRNFLQEKQK